MLPDIPLTELFIEQEYPRSTPPVRWYSQKTVKEILGIGDRQIRRYVQDGRLETKYKTVKGRRRVYYSNIYVQRLAHYLDCRRNSKKNEEESNETWAYIDEMIKLLTKLNK